VREKGKIKRYSINPNAGFEITARLSALFSDARVQIQSAVKHSLSVSVCIHPRISRRVAISLTTADFLACTAIKEVGHFNFIAYYAQHGIRTDSVQHVTKGRRSSPTTQFSSHR